MWAREYLSVNFRDFFDSASLARPAMPCSHDTSVGSLPEFLDKLVLGIDHEGGVERGEGVPLHS